MKKLVIMMFAALMLLSGCSKSSSSTGSAVSGGNQNTNPIVGTWSKPAYSYQNMMRRDEVWYFMNENTATKLGTCYDQPYTFYFNGSPIFSIETPVPTKSGWYHKGDNVILTYLYEDNKVGLTDGTIFTYMDGKLYKDNSNILLEKW